MTSTPRPRTGAHLDPAMTVRVPDGLKDTVKAHLSDRGLDLRGLIVAALTATSSDLDATLRFLRPYWPAPKKRGRPRELR